MDDQAQLGISGSRLPESTLLSGRDIKVLQKVGVGLGVSVKQVKLTGLILLTCLLVID